MAERRMFAKTIIDSDAFLEMPLSSQALYFHLSMRADDEGFVNSPKKIGRMLGASEDDFKVLLAKNFLIPFDSGVVVIKHWLVHNYIQKDRFKETVYTEERQQLSVKNNGAYTLDTSCIQNGYKMDTDCIQSVSKVETQDRLGKDSIGKVNNSGVNSIDNNSNSIEGVPTLDEVKAYCAARKSPTDPVKFYNYYSALGWKLGSTPIQDWQALLRSWEVRDAKATKPTGTKFSNFEQRDDDLNKLYSIGGKK